MCVLLRQIKKLIYFSRKQKTIDIYSIDLRFKMRRKKMVNKYKTNFEWELKIIKINYINVQNFNGFLCQLWKHEKI